MRTSIRELTMATWSLLADQDGCPRADMHDHIVSHPYWWVEASTCAAPATTWLTCAQSAAPLSTLQDSLKMTQL